MTACGPISYYMRGKSLHAFNDGSYHIYEFCDIYLRKYHANKIKLMTRQSRFQNLRDWPLKCDSILH